MNRICSVDYCDRLEHGRQEICEKHLKRKLRGASDWTQKTPYEMTLEERFWSKVDKESVFPDESDDLVSASVRGTYCWQWLGAPMSDGYARIQIDGKGVKAYRFSYELNVGEIPAGLILDHLCRNRMCVNPSHLEPVTHRVNHNRGLANLPHKKCRKGHALDPSTARKSRRCDTCLDDTLESRRKRQRDYVAKLRESPVPADKHGTLYAYGSYGCRCDDCRAAKAADTRIRRQEKRKA